MPKPLFEQNYSQILLSSEGKLLGATIAKDEQWRFPMSDSIPNKFKICIKEFEDAYFNYHLGVNPFSLIRALYHNVVEGKITSGGSTITMQTIRLAKGNPKRTYWEKCKEIIQSIRLELSYSKNEILNLYATHTPYGGNVVGLQAASWRYYGKLPHQLSWAESATLAVLPNAPALIYPGKNQESLLKKRNKLLLKLKNENYISTQDYELFIEEPLPEKPFPVPQIAPHALQYSAKLFPNTKVKSTIKYHLQELVNQVVKTHQFYLSQREIYNIAVMISNIKTGEIEAYVGNTFDEKFRYQNAVDINLSKRSSGSILKPFLFAAMLNQGELLPNQLLPDIPGDITQNFSKTYSGLVPANVALQQSLNIPAIYMLRTHSVPSFISELQRLGFTTINKPASYYGLSLIIGGAEITPFELNTAYRNFAAQGFYGNKANLLHNLKISSLEKEKLLGKLPFETASINTTLQVLKNVARPSSESGWQLYDNKTVAWKTGTSHGFKDAWSVGITEKYVISVWVGNATGEGRPGIIGVKAAAPVLFDLIHKLPSRKQLPVLGDFKKIETCAISGYPPSAHCETIHSIDVPKNIALNLSPCPYHKTIYLDQTEKFTVSPSCYPASKIISKKAFVISPEMAMYFKNKNPWYVPVPPPKEGCQSQLTTPMLFVYPKQFTQIALPKDEKGNIKPIVIKVSHAFPNQTLYWTCNDTFLGTTTESHSFPIKLHSGKHIITVTDALGNQISKKITVL